MSQFPLNPCLLYWVFFAAWVSASCAGPRDRAQAPTAPAAEISSEIPGTPDASSSAKFPFRDREPRIGAAPSLRQAEPTPPAVKKRDLYDAAPSLQVEPQLPISSLPRKPSELPEIPVDDLDRESLMRAIRNQIEAMEEPSLSRTVPLAGRILQRRDLKETLDAFLDLLQENLAPEEFNRRVREEFSFRRVGTGKHQKVLFTGYYTPVIEASPVRTGEYIYPLYRIPEEPREMRLIRNPLRGRGGVPPRADGHALYGGPRWAGGLDRPLSPPGGRTGGGTGGNGSWRDYTREQIDRLGILENRDLEIAWLKDDLERFFLHIQGSGVLLFPGGRSQGVRFAAANNHPYRGIGKLMVRDGLLDRTQRSMQGIKQYLRRHPEKIPKYFYQNKRYIFFSFTDTGPRGSGGGELTGGRSIATDKSIYPAGGLAFIVVRTPVLNADGVIREWKRVSRFVVDQDTGADIQGSGRADFYFGTGRRAGVMAGSFKEWGEMYYLLKNE
ncbi:MAG: MltA domain-containing protein [Nitrospinaceae bacterium]